VALFELFLAFRHLLFIAGNFDIALAVLEFKGQFHTSFCDVTRSHKLEQNQHAAI
jgi:hypothetical protein